MEKYAFTQSVDVSTNITYDAVGEHIRETVENTLLQMHNADIPKCTITWSLSYKRDNAVL